MSKSKVVRYILLGAATSLAAASTFRRLTAPCGLVLLTQVLTHTTYFTIVAMSAQPTTATVSTDIQSAVSLTFSGSSDFGYLLVEQGITSSFGTAEEKLSWSTNGYSNIQKSPLYIPRSGFFRGGSFDYQASGGYLWSGTTISDTNAYILDYFSSNVTPARNSNRQNGFPVRCITRHFYIIIQKKNQDMCLFFFSC